MSASIYMRVEALICESRPEDKVSPGGGGKAVDWRVGINIGERNLPRDGEA